MDDKNLNGIEDAVEDAQQMERYKSRAVSAKFKQQVSYGVGAAMVFGLVSAVAAKLFGLAFGGASAGAAGAPVVAAAAAASAVTLPAMLGLVALGVVGVGLLYLSANYLSENTLMDQALQAKQIGAATRGHAPEMVQTIEPKVSNFPIAAGVQPDIAAPDASPNAAPEMDAPPSTRISGERSLADTLVARGAANENAPSDKLAASWEEKMAMADDPAFAKARG